MTSIMTALIDLGFGELMNEDNPKLNNFDFSSENLTNLNLIQNSIMNQDYDRNEYDNNNSEPKPEFIEPLFLNSTTRKKDIRLLWTHQNLQMYSNRNHIYDALIADIAITKRNSKETGIKDEWRRFWHRIR